MIEQGRVQVNGAVVTTLGTKADASRDHIRVDGKLLHGAERLRYFVLNKPKGFVTTVKDPEGRPTVMQFFDKMRERLYPVGRLDYMSEGLLLVTNDGELANKLTKAGSGVEKVYLVKVAGQPTEEELELLRGGVSIERGKPGSAQVRTSPARIRQVRAGRQSLVRSCADRRAQPRTAQDVCGSGAFCGEDSPRGLRAAGSGPGTGQHARAGAGRAGGVAAGRRGQAADAESKGSAAAQPG